MKIIVSTCDKYDYLLPGFVYCFNKYWPGQTIDVVGYQQPMILPDNVRFNCLNPVEDKPFTHYLHKYIAGLTDNHLVFLFDDYWMTEPISTRHVSIMEQLVINAGVDKADLSTNTHYFAHGLYKSMGPGNPPMVEATQDAQYRASTQPAIWKRTHFLKLLDPVGKTPWQFEIDNPAANNNGARIVGLETQTYKYANVVHKGEPDYYMIEKIPMEDRLELQEMGYTNILEHRLNFNQFRHLDYMDGR